LGLEAGLKRWFKGEYQYPKRFGTLGFQAGFKPIAAMQPGRLGWWWW
jgi:hypothetical protein